jgi:hypothetical protein
MPTGEERRGALCGKIACTVRCRRWEETRPVGKPVRPGVSRRPYLHRALELPPARSPERQQRGACGRARVRRSASALRPHRRRRRRTRVHAWPKRDSEPIGNRGRTADEAANLDIGEMQGPAPIAARPVLSCCYGLQLREGWGRSGLAHAARSPVPGACVAGRSWMAGFVRERRLWMRLLGVAAALGRHEDPRCGTAPRRVPMGAVFPVRGVGSM